MDRRFRTTRTKWSALGAVLVIGLAAPSGAEQAKSVTREHETTVQKTDDGLRVDRIDTRTGPNGGVRTRETTAIGAQADGGSRSWSSNTQGQATGPNGGERSWTTQRAGSSVPNDQGGRDRRSSALRTGANGRQWTRDSSSSTWRNGDGQGGMTRQSEVSGPRHAHRRASR